MVMVVQHYVHVKPLDYILRMVREELERRLRDHDCYCCRGSRLFPALIWFLTTVISV